MRNLSGPLVGAVGILRQTSAGAAAACARGMTATGQGARSLRSSLTAMQQPAKSGVDAAAHDDEVGVGTRLKQPIQRGAMGELHLDLLRPQHLPYPLVQAHEGGSLLCGYRAGWVPHVPSGAGMDLPGVADEQPGMAQLRFLLRPPQRDP